MTRATPWEAGRFDARSESQRLLFGHMYEDSAIESEAFAPGSRVFCIASAGCTALALARHCTVTAVDINPVQLAYAEQRAAGGADRAGAAERILEIGRRALALLGWRRRTVESFLGLEHPAEQIAFWNEHLNSAAFRLATRLLLSVVALRTIYALPFLDILPPHFAAVMRARLERGWRMHANRRNPYARALLLGEWPAASGQPLREPIRFACADAAGFLESCAPASFDGFALSNILDGAPLAYRRRLLAAVRHAGTDDSTMVLRSFAEPRQLTETNLAARDRSILWGVVDVVPVREP